MTEHIRRRGDGAVIALGPNEVVITLAAEDTDGAFSLIEYTAPPDGPSPPPHVHETTDEVIYVLEGELDCRVGPETFTAARGATVWIPRGTTHTFTIAGSRAARVLLWYAPGGFEGYFREMGAFLASLPPGPPDEDAVAEKAAELSEVYDQTIVAPD